MWQWKVLLHDFRSCQSGSRMTLANAGMAWQILGTKHLRAQQSMAYVRFRTITLDARRIGFHDADVMQHRRLKQKVTIQIKLRMCLGYIQRLPRHSIAMAQKDVFQLGIISAILFNKIFPKHF